MNKLCCSGEGGCFVSAVKQLLERQEHGLRHGRPLFRGVRTALDHSEHPHLDPTPLAALVWLSHLRFTSLRKLLRAKPSSAQQQLTRGTAACMNSVT